MANLKLNFNLIDYNIVTEVDAQGNPLTTPDVAFGSNTNDYIRLTVYGRFNKPVLTENSTGVFYSAMNVAPFTVQVPGVSNLTDINLPGEDDFIIYTAGDLNKFIKVNEVLAFNGVPEGNYNIQLDFLNQYKPSLIGNTAPLDDKFIIKQISPSRLEVRLKLLNTSLNESNQLDLSSWNNTSDEYDFKHVLYTGQGKNIPIVNYHIDTSTEGIGNQSIILKLYEPLPGEIQTLQTVTIEKEILITQTQQVYYFSDVKPKAAFGSLDIDNEYDYINFDYDAYTTENLDDISGSLSNESLNSIVSGSTFDYPNLNTNFNEFENHTFLGSAKRKLENFKTKVEKIQNFYGEISSSLLITASITTGSDDDNIIRRRLELFNQIETEKLSFTPYEKFLYFDGQHQTTASAPGLGNDYVDSTFALRTDVNTSGDKNFPTFFKTKDGFENVYVVTASKDTHETEEVRLFRNKYRAEQKPFYGHSGSVYMSFLVKGDDWWHTAVSSSTISHSNSQNAFNGVKQSPKTLHTEFISQPAITSSEYRRYIIVASSSYYTPTEHTPNIGYDAASIDSFGLSTNQIEVLSGSIKTGSHEITAGGIYQSLATYITGSNEDPTSDMSFSGSIMPHNDLFDLHLGLSTGGTAVTSSTFTDIRISLNNPTDVLPFDNLYHTSSANWTNWYNGIHDSASAFDELNIHSLENNLPSYIKQSSQYNDLKVFLSLLGENLDVIKNHIDGLETLHNRNYDKLDSVPTNLLPIITENLGWEAINPFTGSLESYFGNSLSNVTNVKTIQDNTWRKLLNNLIYIYKSKGTNNAIRALFNVYGYPSDVLAMNEFGGSTQPQNDSPISPSTPTVGTSNNDTNLSQTRDNVSFIGSRDRLYHYRFAGTPDGSRCLNLDWSVDNADINTVEFVYKHHNTENTQELLVSSGSDSIAATGSVFISSSTTSVFDGHTLGITSSDGTMKTYIFDDDSDGATGTTDGFGRVRIQINSLSDASRIAGEVSKSILSSNGHNGKVTINTYERFVNSDGDVVTDSEGRALFVESPTGSYLELTQLVSGEHGNTTIGTTLNSAAVTSSIESLNGGKDGHHHWDLRLLPSANQISSSFQFRLNNSSHGSLDIASNAVSMSTDYLRVGQGSLWNVMLQRMSSSISGSGTNEYRLLAGLQKKDIISKLAFISMSVSGGLVEDDNYRANVNWYSTGSGVSPVSASNLFVGRDVSGSMAEIRGWKTPLSMSKFRLHTLNKFSTVGNNINSHKNDLIYHFKLNENYTTSSVSSSSQTIAIIDSNPNGPSGSATDYTFTKPSDIATGSLLYGFDLISTYGIGVQSIDISSRNSNKVIIKPTRKVFSNLNPFDSSTISLFAENSKPKRVGSIKLEINRSPQDFIDKFIVDKIQGFSLETLYGNPTDYYSSSYGSLVEFREQFFKDYNISVDTNKFIRSHENIFNQSLVEGIKKLVPARSTLSDRNTSIGVTIKPTILEKSKVEHKKHSIEVNPNYASGSIEITTNTNYKSGFSIVETYEKPHSGSISINNIISKTASQELPYSSSISVNDSITKEISYEQPKSSSFSIPDDYISKEMSYEQPKSSSFSIPDDYISKEMSYELPKSGSFILRDNISEEISYTLPISSSISVGDIIKESGSFILPKSSSVSIPNVITKEISLVQPKSSSLSIIDDYISKEISLDKPRSSSISILPGSTGELIHPISGTNDYINTKGFAAFNDLHKLWGTSSSDVHFLNMAAEDAHTSSFGDYNVNHIERRNYFISIGDVEVYSGSIAHASDFSNQSRFYNRELIKEFVHSNITYDSYINGSPGTQVGRALGKTRYFYTASDGTITLPSNHVRQFSNPWVDRMYQGTQNITNSGSSLQPHNTYTDLSSASFYTVKVTGGENQLVVKSGDPTLDGDDKIIY